MSTGYFLSCFSHLCGFCWHCLKCPRAPWWKRTKGGPDPSRFFRTQQAHCTLELTTVVPCTGPGQDQDTQHPGMDWGGIDEPPFLTDWLLVAGFLGRENPLSLRVWPLVVKHAPVSAPTPRSRTGHRNEDQQWGAG